MKLRKRIIISIDCQYSKIHGRLYLIRRIRTPGIMSMFSSLNYLLTKAASAINPSSTTGAPEDVIFQETKSSNKLSPIASNESSTINTTTHTPCQHLLLGAGTSSMIEEINKTIITSTPENWTNFVSLPIHIPKVNLVIENNYTTENGAEFSNETFPNAEHLLESWWNIFDARYLRHGWGLTLTLIMVYMIILVVGVIGNVMVILVVILRPKMRTVTNMFITNLAVADFFVIVFCVPSTLLANIFAPWILGKFMCKAVAYVQGVSVCSSAYSLAAISLDRCQAVYRSYERPRGFTRRICARTVVAIWVAAISLTIPWTVTFDVQVSDYDGLRYCVETWVNEEQGDMYFLIVNLGCFYAIPLLLIFISNWVIYCHVSDRSVPQDSASSAPLRKMHQETRRHVLKMLGIVTLTFLISWLPVYILVIIIKFSDHISESEYKILGILMPIAQWLGTWNSSINPILYAFLNKKFRKMFKSILPAWIPVKSRKKYYCKTPSFTTGYTGKSFVKSSSSSKSNNLCRNQSVHNNSQYQANLLINRLKTPTKPNPSIVSVTSVIIDRSVIIDNIGITGQTTTEIVTHL